MTYIVNFVGIIYFHICSEKDGLSAFFPDGRNPGGGIPPHIASLFIEVKDHDSDNWWRDYKRVRTLQLEPRPHEIINVDVFEFEVPERATITFSNDGKALDPGNVLQTLPGVTQLDRSFTVDTTDIEIIARVPLTGGALEAREFEGAAVVEWTITQHSGPITITAQTETETRRIILKPATEPIEVVFSNTSDLIKEGREKIVLAERAAEAAERSNGPVRVVEAAPEEEADDDVDEGDSSSVDKAGKKDEASEDKHASIYGKLDKRRNGQGIAASDFPDFRAIGLHPSRSRHAYLNFLRRGKELPLPKCSPICCS